MDLVTFAGFGQIAKAKQLPADQGPVQTGLFWCVEISTFLVHQKFNGQKSGYVDLVFF